MFPNSLFNSTGFFFITDVLYNTSLVSGFADAGSSVNILVSSAIETL